MTVVDVAELTSRLASGDGTALEEAFDAYAPVVRRVALRVTRDRNLAEDVTQEVFIHLWQRPFAFDPRKGTLQAWLSTIARRRAIDLVRREQAWSNRHEENGVAEHEPPVDDEVVSAIVSQRVRAVVAELPVPLRQAVVLAYYHGHTQRQVAVLLGIPEGTAKSRIRMGLRRVAAGLRRHGIKP